MDIGKVEMESLSHMSRTHGLMMTRGERKCVGKGIRV